MPYVFVFTVSLIFGIPSSTLSPPVAGPDLHPSAGTPRPRALRLQRRQRRRGAAAGRLQCQGAGAGGALHQGGRWRSAEDAGDRLRGVAWGIGGRYFWGLPSGNFTWNMAIYSGLFHEDGDFP